MIMARMTDTPSRPRQALYDAAARWAADEGARSRRSRDTIRLDIQLAHESVGGHEVLIYVNGTEMTAAGAGMGMDPFDILIPVNRLAAGPEPRYR